MKRVAVLTVACFAQATCVIEPQQPLGDVRVWAGELSLPAYREGPPDPNPPFEYFDPPRINYPYTIRDNLTGEREDRVWDAVFLENDYLRCTVLPEIGGHLYSCTDKLNGEEVFYANPSIKLSKIGYRGAWAAFGVEFNFPVSHNWMSTSPVDFAFRENADGSGSVWVGNIDRVVGTQWTVELRLRPGRAALEQHTTLYNRSDFRHRFYWWTNAAVRVWDDSRVLYPMTHTASHGFRDIDTWPVDSRGTDNSVVGNHLFGPVSRFSHGSREPYMAVYHPRTDAGVVHYSSRLDLPAKKIWSFGGDDRGLDWREALSDDGSAYVEIQAGLFRNQETYEFLEPEDRIRFSETWVPVRGLGGISRGNAEAAVHVERTDSSVLARFNPVARLEGVRALLLQGDRVLRQVVLDADPAQVIRLEAPIGRLGPGPVTARLEDQSGTEVIAHTEGVFDVDEDVPVGPVAPTSLPSDAERGEGDWLSAGTEQEREGRRLRARMAYLAGLERFPGSLELRRALGRIEVGLKRYGTAARHLQAVTERVSTDRESWYYLGHALLASGDTSGAASAWEKSQSFGTLRRPSRYHLAALHARRGDYEGAQQLLDGGGVRSLLMQSALLRHLNRLGAAARVLSDARAQDPTGSQGRFEATRQGRVDDDLWIHLAGEPDRIVGIAAEYGRFGLLDDALGLLGYDYPDTPAVAAEPGQPHPADYPILHYYRAHYEALAGLDPRESLEKARASPLRYVFPHRHDTGPVLESALTADPGDMSALFLRGLWAMSTGRVDAALTDWERVIRIRPGIPALHWMMGMAVLESSGDTDRAIGLFDAGIDEDPTNEGLYFALDGALSRQGAAVEERAAVLTRHPDPGAMSPDLVYLTARVLADAGRFDEAEALFRNRYFVREEGGTNPREVWLEIRLGRAERDSEISRCDLALEVMEGLTEPVDGVLFSTQGLADWLERRPDLSERRAALRNRCPDVSN